ncbi:SRPBCC family protein [Saccharospirillum salsuginis]|uniref:Activator of Hsp90 ATPase homologue 1/2-like C-terminal domain-containing protein n=1 Tax=Saccharospirillum salsuginis TaxID=418750 RepID=A0A918N776_9GAMM|nr:SRPBCC family protein [Saccharospirillum salsuginis]GGX43237.1 hypothetical protein GCM10007392_07430 [Saccharospirillum salsuginis]
MTTSIHQENTFNTTPQALFDAFVNAEKHSAFTGSPARIEPVEGSAFSVYDGGVDGRQIELVTHQRIIQAWRGADWPDGVYSIVRLDFQPLDDRTLLVLDHTGIPEGSAAHLESGWYKMYWEPLKTWLEARSQ